MQKRLTQLGIGLIMAASLTLAGCGSSGGGGGSDGNGGGGGATVVPVGGNNLLGPADPVQDALIDAGNGAGDAPVVGDTAAALLSALVALLDAPDGLASGFQDFATSQDPNDLFAGGEDAGAALLSFAAGLSETLIQLSEEGQAIPGSDALLPTLLDLQQQVQDGLSGASNGGDLTAITDLLVQLSGQLAGLSGQVPPQVADAPLVGDLLAALGTGSADLATILDSVGRLNGDDTSAALTQAFQNVLSALTGSLPGVGDNAMLTGAVSDATMQFERGLAIVLNPLFQALRGVLAPITGEASPLAGGLDGLLGGDTGGLAGLLAGGGMSSGGTQIPLLSDLLAGLPLLGELLTQLPGGGALGAGGLGSLTTILDQGGTGGIPLLGDLLAGIPNLSAPGGSGAPSPAALTDLLTSLLSLNGDGLPVLGDVLAGAGGAGSLDLPIVGNVLDDLLGNLTGMFGADANGGFLDGSEGLLSLGGIVTGLLGSILGLLGL